MAATDEDTMLEIDSPKPSRISSMSLQINGDFKKPEFYVEIFKLLTYGSYGADHGQCSNQTRKSPCGLWKQNIDA